MADYIQEFKDYVNFIKKKLLRNTISQNYSTNLVKLGLLLSTTKCDNPQITKWFLTFHKACKNSKISLLNNKNMMVFKLKLLKISKKLLNEIKMEDLHKSKIRKLIFTKKISKSFPNDAQRLISDISIYIGEAVNEKDIDTISVNMSNECLPLKRKRFSRQVKESLFKYCNDFNNFIELPNQSLQLDKQIDELTELSDCLEKFDSTISNINLTKTLTDIELFINSENINITPIKLDYDYQFNNISVQKLETSEVKPTEDLDFFDFNVVEEWNECLDNTISLNKRETLLETDVTIELISSMEEINNQLLCNINFNGNLTDSKNILSKDLVITKLNSLNDVCENKTISNIQQSYLFDFNKEVNKIFKTVKTEGEKSQSQNDTDDDLLFNRNLYSKPKASIKIMNLKKPHAYLSNENNNETNSDEILLQNIPLPMKINHHKTGNNSTSFTSKNVHCNPMINSKPIVEDESDTAEEELIPQSILDFSEVLNDEFDGKENIDDSSNIYQSDIIIGVDNKVEETGNRSIILKPESTIKPCSENTEIKSVVLESISDNYNETHCSSELSNSICNSSNIRYKKTQNFTNKTNYSVFNIDDSHSNTESKQYYHNKERYDYDYMYTNHIDIDDYTYYPRNHNQNYNGYYNNNYRNYDRGNRRLFRNFLRYTCQSSNAERRWLNESNRFNNEY